MDEEVIGNRESGVIDFSYTHINKKEFMMKNKRTALWLVLIAVMAVTECTKTKVNDQYEAKSDLQYESEGDFLVKREGSGIIITRYAGTKWKASIPPVIQKLPVTGIGDGAFRNTKLTSVTIPNSVTSIGRRAFGGSYYLTEIKVDADNKAYISEDGVLYNKDKTILLAYPAGKAAVSFTIPDSVISIEDDAFVRCYTLTEIKVASDNTAYTSVNGILYNKDKTILLAYPAGKTAVSFTIPNGVKSVGDAAFSDCVSLTSITIPNGVTAIGKRAFERCRILAGITIPASVTGIGAGAFSDCWNLTEIKVDGDRNAYTVEDGVLYNKSKTLLHTYPRAKTDASFTIPNGVKSIEDFAFYNCYNIESVTIPDSVTYIGQNAFGDCKSLTSVMFRGTIPWSGFSNDADYPPFLGDLRVKFYETDKNNGTPGTYHTYTGYPLYNPTWKMEQHDIEDDFDVERKGSGILITKYTGSENEVHIPPRIQNFPVIGIGEWAFSDCASLTIVTIPDSVTSIGNGAFDSCTSLTSITIPNSVTNIENSVFGDCASLASVTIPNSVKTIGEKAFFKCASLTGIIIPNSVIYIGDSAFRNCDSLTSITIPNSVKSIGEDAFKDCTGLTSVTIPNSVTKIDNGTFNECKSLASITIPNSVTSIGNGAFSRCYSLAGITIPNSVTIIGNYAFYGCTRLISVIIPDSVTSIGQEAFSYCDRLASLTVGNGNTSIGERAFAKCGKLASVTISSGVIGELAFLECISITSVTLGNKVTKIGAGAFYLCDNILSVTFQGTISSSMYTDYSAVFPGDLHTKFYAKDSDNGTPGTYTRPNDDSSKWTKK